MPKASKRSLGTVVCRSQQVRSARIRPLAVTRSRQVRATARKTASYSFAVRGCRKFERQQDAPDCSPFGRSTGEGTVGASSRRRSDTHLMRMLVQ